MKYAEALLGGTDALPSNTVEISHFQGKLLVRTRQANGISFQRKFPLSPEGREEAFDYLWQQANLLKNEHRCKMKE